jgi:hypothetical protein
MGQNVMIEVHQMKCKYPPCEKDVPEGTGTRREYCSNAHKQADYRRRKMGTTTQDGERLLALEQRVEDLEQAYQANTQLIKTHVAQSRQRIEELERALQETQDQMLNLSKQIERPAEPSTETETSQEAETQEVAQPEPTYEGEWTITGAGGQVVYHDPDAQHARRRLDTLVTNDRTQRWQLHTPHFTPSSGIATEITTNLPNDVHKRLVLSTGETIDFLQDFTVPGLPGYVCRANHKDVKAELTVYPYEYSGDYSLTQTQWGKISNVGREGPKQAKRAQYLLATLIDRTEGEMRKAGWVESGMRDDVSPARPLWRKADTQAG